MFLFNFHVCWQCFRFSVKFIILTDNQFREAVILIITNADILIRHEFEILTGGDHT
jgi:hypothetical protein